MITSKIKVIFGISVFSFILHGIEEISTNFYDFDPISLTVFGPLSSLSSNASNFIVFQAMLWLLLIFSFFLLLGEKWRFYTITVIGVIYILEIHHIFKAILTNEYYPGLYTSLVFPILGFFFWKEWLRVYKLKR